MVKREQEIREGIIVENGTLTLRMLLTSPDKPEKVRTFAHASLCPGGEVAYHVHEGESECYFILSGEGTYDDNGAKTTVRAGDVTFTPSGTGHGLVNTGNEDLCFMALIVLD